MSITTLTPIVSSWQYARYLYPDVDACESVLREMCEITNQKLGEEHTKTLKFRAELSSLILERGRSEDAGLNVHKYISKHWEAIQNASLWNSDTLLEEPTEGRGWKAMISLNNELARYQAPFHFVWANHSLYTLPIRNVKLSPVFPSREEMESVWKLHRPVSEVESGPRAPHYNAKADALMFQSSVNSDLSIDLRVPYIPYSHFVSSLSFKQGTPYLEYVKAAEDFAISRSIYKEADTDTPIKIGKFMEDLEPDSVGENEEVMNAEENSNLNLGSPSHVSEVQGFFNCIPADSSLLLGETFEPQLNLVSSKWADWKHFTLHPPPNNQPLLNLSDGTEIRCHGYISGTWTDIDLQGQRKIFKLFVVDAVFSATKVAGDATYFFALSASALKSPGYHKLSGIEKRKFCGKLNPSLYRLSVISLHRLRAAYKRKMKDAQVNNSSEDADLWEEMNRREQWDRDFELRKPTNQADKNELKRALSIEESARLAWDERYRHRQSVSEAGTGNSIAKAAHSSNKVETEDKKQ